MMTWKRVKDFLLCICVVLSFSGHSSRCSAEPLYGNKDLLSQRKTGSAQNQDGRFTKSSQTNDLKGDSRDFRDDVTGEIIKEDKISSLEDEVAELKSQLSVLTDALVGSSDRGPRIPRSVTQSTILSDSVWNLSSFRNCTCRGDPGPAGPPGISGRDGRDGRDAPMACDRGCQPVTGNIPEQASPSPPVDQRTNSRRADGVYVRWGRTVCREGSELIYQGFIGGTLYSAHGGATNHQCMPLDPIYDLVINGNQELRAHMYGAEMQTRDDGEWSSLFDHAPPCAVCLSLQRPTILMIPARNICPSSDWTLEYKGQLMTERSNHAAHYRSEFICVDRHPETIPRTAPDVNGILLHLVEGRCVNGGGLPCGPYIEGHELSSAVCSK